MTPCHKRTNGWRPVRAAPKSALSSASDPEGRETSQWRPRPRSQLHRIRTTATASLLPVPRPIRRHPPQGSPATITRNPVRPSATYSISADTQTRHYALRKKAHRALHRVCLRGSEAHQTGDFLNPERGVLRNLVNAFGGLTDDKMVGVDLGNRAGGLA